MSYRLHAVPDWASLAVHLALAEMGQSFEMVLHAREDLDTPAYRAIHPFGKIPALETPQGPMFETGAILLWLAEVHGTLAPQPGEADRGRFLSWFAFVNNTVHPGMMALVHPHRPAGEAGEALVGPVARDGLRGMYAALDALAATGPWWLSPGRPSVLSLYLAVLLRWTSVFAADPGLNIPVADHPALARMVAGLQARPAVQAALAAEGLAPDALTAAA